MKNLFRTLMVLTFISPTAYSYDESFGVGAILGDPTGISVKYLINDIRIDAALSYNNDELIIYSDYLKHFQGRLGKQNAFVSALTPYIGAGPVLAFRDEHKHHHDNDFVDDDEDDDWALGVRVPVGIEWMNPEKKLPIGIGVEVVPGLEIVPETEGFFQAGLTARYYF